MFWVLLYGALLLFLAIYGYYVNRKVDRKYRRVAKRKAVVRWDDDKAA